MNQTPLSAVCRIGLLMGAYSLPFGFGGAFVSGEGSQNAEGQYECGR